MMELNDGHNVSIEEFSLVQQQFLEAKQANYELVESDKRLRAEVASLKQQLLKASDIIVQSKEKTALYEAKQTVASLTKMLDMLKSESADQQAALKDSLRSLFKQNAELASENQRLAEGRPTSAGPSDSPGASAAGTSNASANPNADANAPAAGPADGIVDRIMQVEGCQVDGDAMRVSVRGIREVLAQAAAAEAAARTSLQNEMKELNLANQKFVKELDVAMRDQQAILAKLAQKTLEIDHLKDELIHERSVHKAELDKAQEKYTQNLQGKIVEMQSQGKGEVADLKKANEKLTLMLESTRLQAENSGKQTAKRIKELEDLAETRRKESEALEVQMAELMLKAKVADDAKEVATRELIQLQSRHSDLQNTAEVSAAGLAKLQNSYTITVNRLHDVEKDLRDKEDAYTELEQRMLRTQRKLEGDLQAAAENADAAAAALAAEKAAAEAAEAKWRGEVATLQADAAALRTKLRAEEDALAATRAELAQASDACAALRTQVAGLEVDKLALETRASDLETEHRINEKKNVNMIKELKAELAKQKKEHDIQLSELQLSRSTRSDQPASASSSASAGGEASIPSELEAMIKSVEELQLKNWRLEEKSQELESHIFALTDENMKKTQVLTAHNLLDEVPPITPYTPRASAASGSGAAGGIIGADLGLSQLSSKLKLGSSKASDFLGNVKNKVVVAAQNNRQQSN